MNTKKILILGAGVSGLSCGILLRKEGYDVTIWAKDFPPYTTSNKAAAVWYPFICGPKDKATKWARVCLNYFRDEIISDPKSGCKVTSVVEVFDHQKEDPWWKAGVDTYKRITQAKLPEGYTDGYEIDSLVMDTDVYMEYLVTQYTTLGGGMIQKTVTDIREAVESYDTVVNCTGLGSRELCSDTSIYPCRGQIVLVKPNGFDYSLFEEEGPQSLAYIIPRLNDIVLGGTAQDNDWNLEIDAQDTRDILRKCSSLFPAFKDIEIITQKVGLRPARKTIRLEIESSGGKHIIHNYGHGGSGFTLSWGCAKSVVELISSL